MKILFWCEVFLPHLGGIEITVRQLVEALRVQGHESEIITNRHAPDLPAREILPGAVVHRLDITKALAGRDPREVYRVCQEVREVQRRFQPDLNHLFLAGPLLTVLNMTNRPPAIPIITSLLSPWEALRAGGESVMQMLRKSAVVVAASESLRQMIQEALPEVTDRVKFLLPSVQTPVLSPSPLPMAPPVLLCLGRMVEEKGFDIAIRALALLDRRWQHVRLVITGEGTARPDLEALCHQMGLNERVQFNEAITHAEVPALLNQTTLMLVPSRWEEPSGMVILDAALMARPVVASRVGGIPEVVVEGETGLLVENENPAALAQSIQTLLEDPEKLQAMGLQAKRRVEECFGLGTYVARHLEWYRKYARSEVAPAPSSTTGLTPSA